MNGRHVRAKPLSFHRQVVMPAGTSLYHGNWSPFSWELARSKGTYFGLFPVISLWILTEQAKDARNRGSELTGRPRLYEFVTKADIELTVVTSIDIDLMVHGKCQQNCIGMTSSPRYSPTQSCFVYTGEESRNYELFLTNHHGALDQVELLGYWDVDIDQLHRHCSSDSWCPIEALLDFHQR